MAASSSDTKNSPSEKPLGKSENDAAKTEDDAIPPTTEAAPAVATTVATAATAATTSTLPTYESVQASQHYTVAKTLLNNGDFEDALQTIEEGLELTRAILLSEGGLAEDEGLAVHPALGPFHYLYGTALLYSIEESTDDLQPMMQPQGGDPNAQGDDDAADDTQIAYENLDLGRVILELYVESLSSHRKSDASGEAAASEPALALDLAQIRLREGDLHRLEGKYETALADYQACCSLRQQVVESSGSSGETPLLGPYDRKLADVHYNLALTYSLMIASSATTGEAPTEAAPVAAAAAAAPESDLSTAVTLSPEQLDLYRRHSSHHYYQCGRILCGQLAILAQRDADEFFAQVAAALPSFKTTGEDASSLDESVVPPALARVQLRTLRQHVGKLPLASVDAPEMAALLELLEEIQEAMDEAEASEAGVQQVASMKAAIAAAAAACHAADDDQDPDAAAAVSTAGFGSQAAAAATAKAQPLMAVRKKKKRPPTEAGQEPNSKHPKSSSE